MSIRIPKNLVFKSKLSPRDGFVILRQVSPVCKMGP